MTQQVQVVEERGLSARPDQGVDSRWCVIGNSSSGTVGLSLLLGNPTPAIASYGYGMGIDATTHELHRTKIPGSFCKVPNTTPGVLGTIDITGVIGTSLVSLDPLVLPVGEFDAWIRVDTAFVPGTTGGVLSTSHDGGVNWDGPFNIGTATTYTLANGGPKFLFEPPSVQVTALIAYANDIRTKALAHMPYTTGTVHGSADTTSDDAVQIAATTLATVKTLLPTLLTALGLHFARGATVHTTADVTTSLTAATTAVAASSASGTAQDALTAALALAAAFAAHEVLLTAHGAADAVNVVSATVPTRGTLTALDVAKVRTLAPKWAAADLYTAGSPPTGAFQAMKTSDYSYGLIYIEGPMSASECATVSTALDVLNAAGRRPTVIVRTRRPTTGETETAYIAAIKADWATFYDDRIVVCAGDALVIDPVTARKYLRSPAPALLARAILVDRYRQPGAPKDRPLEGVTLTDSTGALAAHDDGSKGNYPGAFNDFRFASFARGETDGTGSNVYCLDFYVMKPTDGRIYSGQVRRISNAAELALSEVSFAALRDTKFFDTDTLLFEETSRNAIKEMLKAPIKAQFGNDIQNPNAEDIVEVAAGGTVANGKVFAYVTVSLRPFLYLGGIKLTFALQVA